MYNVYYIIYVKRKGEIMREIIVDKNEKDQRLDRFLKKYLNKAPNSFIYKMLRKKNIKVNDNKATPETIIVEGDVIKLFLSEETIEKFIDTKPVRRSRLDLDIVYEDDNIIIINKEDGILSHGTGADFEQNIVDSLITYLIDSGEYVPRIEKTFTPSICNRLDRNTSGLIIGGKTFEGLQNINESMRNNGIRRFYRTIVQGRIDRPMELKGYMSKDEERNKVKIFDYEDEDLKEVITRVTPIKYKDGYSLLEVELITGRTHQIRAHLSHYGYPVIGDRKYGNKEVNAMFKEKFNLENQFLHSYKVEIVEVKTLDELNGKVFYGDLKGKMKEIEEYLFN